MRYVVRVTPASRLEMDPFELGSFRWLWLARLRRNHFLSDSFLRSISTVEILEVPA